MAFLSSFTHQCFSCRRSPGVQWILTKTPGGRLALVTSRSMIWFWLASNTCRKARGSVIFASTDLSNRHARLMTPRPSHHVLSLSFRFNFTPVFLSFQLVPVTCYSYIPPLEDTHIYGCFLKGRVVGCHGVPHCPKFPFSTLERPFGKMKGSVYIQQTPPSCKHSFLILVYIYHLTHFGHSMDRCYGFLLSCTLLWFGPFFL